MKLKQGTDFDKFQKEFLGLEVIERRQKISFKYTDDQVERIKESALEQAERVIRTRIDKWGVSEPVINRDKMDPFLFSFRALGTQKKLRSFLVEPLSYSLKS